MPLQILELARHYTVAYGKGIPHDVFVQIKVFGPALTIPASGTAILPGAFLMANQLSADIVEENK